MAHRGKLNALTGVLKCPPVKIFHKFSGNPEFPDEANAACDISTHLSERFTPILLFTTYQSLGMERWRINAMCEPP